VPDPTRRFVDVSGATFARLLGFVVLVALWLCLWQWVLLLVVAIYLAVALDPAVTWLAARRIRRGVTAPLLAVTIAGAVIGFGYFAGSSLVEQGRLLGERVQEMQDPIVDYIAPKVYGHELRLSDLAVIGAFAVGAELGGVVGALVALPLAAIYPAVEQE
jgi:predicted PurR-regulated permease PerM